LIEKNTSTTAMEFSRCAQAGRLPSEEPPAGGWSLKAQQRAAPHGADNVEVDVFQASPDIGRPSPCDGGHRRAGRLPE